MFLQAFSPCAVRATSSSSSAAAAGAGGAAAAAAAAAAVRPVAVRQAGRRAAPMAPPPRALPAVPSSTDPLAVPNDELARVADMISTGGMNDERRAKITALADVLGVTISEAKSMAFRKKALADADPKELAARLQAVADKAGLPLADARRVVALQPGMLLGDAEASRIVDALAGAVRVLAYELRASREQIVRLILDNPSVLHGRDARLGAADVARLAALLEPTGRIAVD